MQRKSLGTFYETFYQGVDTFHVIYPTRLSKVHYNRKRI